MSGYIMTINSLEALEQCLLTGTYSTILSNPKRMTWGIPQEGTFADYLSMKEGDSIYFFHKRKIYGIGQLVNVSFDCKYLNYLEADKPEDYTEEDYLKKNPLLPSASVNNRVFCTFIPIPCFFRNGVDMDDVLNSNPNKFKIFRTMWKVSFIKVDDEENKALQDIILKRNEEDIFEKKNIYHFDNSIHLEVLKNVSTNHILNTYQLLLHAHEGNKMRHEMAIEADLCSILGKENDTPFGKWDFISHQVAASPFKPIDYMDKMDIFGYKYIPGYATISKYLVVEIKKDDADISVLEQIMKYVDWINQEYTHGDYSMIEAYVVAANYRDGIKGDLKNLCVRNFTKGYRPTTACVWNNVKLIKYTYTDGKLHYEEI